MKLPISLCNICYSNIITDPLNPAEQCTCLPCGHLYHISCVQTWFKEKKTCPECRTAMPHKFMTQPVIFNIPEDEFAVDSNATVQLAALKLELADKDEQFDIERKQIKVETSKSFDSRITALQLRLKEVSVKYNKIAAQNKDAKAKITMLEKNASLLNEKLNFFKNSQDISEAIKSNKKGNSNKFREMTKTATDKDKMNTIDKFVQMLETYETEMLSYERKTDVIRNQLEESKEKLGKKDAVMRMQKEKIKNLEEELEKQKELYDQNFKLQQTNRELSKRISEENIPIKSTYQSTMITSPTHKKRRLIISDSEDDDLVHQALNDEYKPSDKIDLPLTISTQKSSKIGFMNLQKPKKKLNFIQDRTQLSSKSLTNGFEKVKKKNNNNTREIKNSIKVNTSGQPLRKFLSQGSILHQNRNPSSFIRKKDESCNPLEKKDDIIINLDSD